MPTYYNPGDPRNTPGYDPYAPNRPPGLFSAPSPAPAAAPRAPYDQAIADTMGEAFRLRDEEDRNRRGSIDFARGEFSRFNNTPAISDEEITTRFGMAGEQANRDANTAYSNVRSALGDNGMTGGSGAQLAGQIESARLGQLTGAGRDLRLYKARLDSDKAMQRLQAASGLADRMNQSPSAVGLDAMGQRAGLEVTLEGIRSAERSAGQAASAQKKAGKSSAAGSIASGLFSAV